MRALPLPPPLQETQADDTTFCHKDFSCTNFTVLVLIWHFVLKNPLQRPLSSMSALGSPLRPDSHILCHPSYVVWLKNKDKTFIYQPVNNLTVRPFLHLAACITSGGLGTDASVTVLFLACSAALFASDVIPCWPPGADRGAFKEISVLV